MDSSERTARTCFEEVLARERCLLADARDRAALTIWRSHLVAEIVDPRSPYASALGHLDDPAAIRTPFLDAWRDLIASALERVVERQASAVRRGTPCAERRIDPERTAVLVLAAVHGGVVLSRLSRDEQPIDAALDLALAPLNVSRRSATGPERP